MAETDDYGGTQEYIPIERLEYDPERDKIVIKEYNPGLEGIGDPWMPAGDYTPPEPQWNNPPSSWDTFTPTSYKGAWDYTGYPAASFLPTAPSLAVLTPNASAPYTPEAPGFTTKAPSWYGGDTQSFISDVLNSYLAPDPVAYPDLWREWVKRHEGEPGAVQSSGWYLGPSGEHVPFYGAAYLPPESVYLPTAPGAPNPTDYAAIRHDPDLQDYYYRALDATRNALGRGLTDAERQGLASSITSGRAWNALDELRAQQLQAADERYRSQAEDYGIRHPGFPHTIAGQYAPSSQAEDYALRHPGFSSHAADRYERQRIADELARLKGSRTLDYGVRHPGSPFADSGIYDRNWEAEDYGLRHPGFPSNIVYNPSPPEWGSPTLTPPAQQLTDRALWAGSMGKGDTLGIPIPFTYDGRPPLFHAIDMIKSRPGTAKDALQYVFDQTYGIPPQFSTYMPPVTDYLAGRVGRSHFSGLGSIGGDEGFQPQFKDAHWYTEKWGLQPTDSTQLGHFLTAVDMAINGSDKDKSAIIRHEQIPDDWGLRGIGAIEEAKRTRATPKDMSAFDWAIVFDVRGDYESRDAMLMSILDPEKHGDLRNRRGNSLEDLILSVRGWELGRQIALGTIKTNDELADWIARNIAQGYY